MCTSKTHGKTCASWGTLPIGVGLDFLIIRGAAPPLYVRGPPKDPKNADRLYACASANSGA
jgi:hypothetical protein